MPRKDIIRTALENRGALIHVADMDEACRISNRIAPEHLELSVGDPQIWLPKLKHAGAIFMGRYTSSRWGTTAPGPTTCCRPPARHVFLAAGGVRLPETQQPDPGFRPGCPKFRRNRLDSGFWRGFAGHAQSAIYRKGK